ncbi:hypothetical protein [Actinomadura atramentaria]|uniref:hypothetical protein n=1 Tax=Actinomadura atramentaria TaxID=1990 RepID=UPI00146F3DDD|nr:hypothetical protein [Actinomadura atramentaria]
MTSERRKAFFSCAILMAIFALWVGIFAFVIIMSMVDRSHNQGAYKAVEGYMRAVASSDGREACKYLTVNAQAAAGGAAGPTGCAASVRKLAESLSDTDRNALARFSSDDIEKEQNTGSFTLKLPQNPLGIARCVLQKQAGTWRITSFQ